MSQRVVAYEGEGRSRRPVYADEGPASVAVDALSAIGTISASRIRETAGHIEGHPSGGAGPVERRLITQAERSVRAEARPSPIAPRTATPSPKEPAMMIEPPQAIIESTYGHAEALGHLAKAASDAAIALEAKRQADAVWQAAQEALAAAWLEVKGTDAPASLDRQGVVTPSRPHNSAEKSRANGTAAMLAKRSPAIGGGSADRAMRVVAAMREGGSTKAAAAILGVSDARVRQLIDTVRKAGTLPDDVAAMIKSKSVAAPS